MNDRWMRMTRLTKLMVIAPMLILAMLIFTFISGELVKLLWNWLAPELFGLRQITFWQAFGLLALCRILFGGFGLSGGGSHRSRRRKPEHWERMTPEERERIRQGLHDRSGRTTPLDSIPSA